MKINDNFLSGAYKTNDNNKNRGLEYRNSHSLTSKLVKRFKRFDKIMSEQCSSHETGLAIAYYALSISYHFKKFVMWISEYKHYHDNI